MARRRRAPDTGDWLFPNVTRAAQDEEQSSLLDVLDNVLNRGAVLTGDIVLGVADVDLIYVKLSVLLAALDKVMRHEPVFKAVAGRPRKDSKSASARGRPSAKKR
jgi:hypothetical protein